MPEPCDLATLSHMLYTPHTQKQQHIPSLVFPGNAQLITTNRCVISACLLTRYFTHFTLLTLLYSLYFTFLTLLYWAPELWPCRPLLRLRSLVGFDRAVKLCVCVVGSIFDLFFFFL